MLQNYKYIVTNAIKNLKGARSTYLALGISNGIAFIFPLFFLIVFGMFYYNIETQFPVNSSQVIYLESLSESVLPNSYNSILESIPAIEVFSYEYLISEQVIYSDDELSNFSHLLVVDNNYAHFYDLEVANFSAEYLLVGEIIANQLFPDQDPIGNPIYIGDYLYEVSGVIKDPGNAQRVILVTDLNNFPAFYGRVQDQILVKVVDADNVESTKELLAQSFEERGINISLTSASIKVAEAQAALSGTFIAISFIGLLVTAFVFLSVANIAYLISDLEKRNLVIKHALGINPSTLLLEKFMQLFIVSGISMIGSVMITYPIITYIESAWTTEGFVLNMIMDNWWSMLLVVAIILLVLILLEVYIITSRLIKDKYSLNI